MVAASLARNPPRTCIVPIDDFYEPRERRVCGREAVVTPWKNI